MKDVLVRNTNPALDEKPVHELLSMATSVVESLNEVLFARWLRRRDSGGAVVRSVELNQALVRGWAQITSISKEAEVQRALLFRGHQGPSLEPFIQEIPMFNAIAKGDRTLRELCGHLAEEEEAETHRQISVLLSEFDQCFARLVELFNVCRRRIGMPEFHQ